MNRSSPATQPRFVGIRTRLTLSFGALFIAILVLVQLAEMYGVPFTTLPGSRERLTTLAFKSLNEVADRKKERLVNWIQARNFDATIMTGNEMVQNAVARLVADLPALQSRARDTADFQNQLRASLPGRTLTRFLNTAKAGYGMYYRLRIAEARTGMILVSTDDSELGDSLVARQFFLQALNSRALYIGGLDHWASGPTLHLAHVILDPVGESVGVMVLDVKIEDVIRPMLHSPEGLGSTGEAILVDPDLRIMTSLKFSVAGIEDAHPLEYTLDFPPARMAARGEEGVTKVDDYRRERVLAAYRYLPISSDYGWGLVVKVDLGELLTPLRQDLVNSILIGLLGVLLAILLIYFISRSLTLPLRALGETADAVAAGRLDARAQVNATDEIGRLGQNFNTMVDRLEGWHRDLEEQVAARTADLNRANEELRAEILERRKAEQDKEQLGAQLQQAQKLEAIGRLAGGIAHDFNNILGAILGYTELALMDTKPDTQIHYGLKQIFKGAIRARDLVRQILTFSRQTQPEKTAVNLGQLLADCVKFLWAGLPATVDLQLKVTPGLNPVWGDPTQLHQVIMNLGANAAQALPDHGGRIVMSLEPFEASRTADLPNAAGGFVQLTVTDTGHGMEQSVLSRVFDPFFTTKEVGQGTGLGLSVVHGIIEEHGGSIRVESRPGQGTSFHVLLPVIDGPAPEPSSAQVGVEI